MKLIILEDYNENKFAIDIDADPIKCITRPSITEPEFQDEHDFPDDESKHQAAYYCSVITTMSGAQYKCNGSVENTARNIKGMVEVK
jgi:hypothetical protein